MPIENITFSQKQERLFEDKLSTKFNPETHSRHAELDAVSTTYLWIPNQVWDDFVGCLG